MGCWGMGISSSDEFCEFYDKFMELYDAGKEIAEIPRELLAEYEREFEPDDGVFHDAYFAIAKAQWMCGGVQPEIMQKVEEIISSGANIEFMRELEASESDLKQRQRNLEKFLRQLQTPRPTVRKRHPPAKPRELPEMKRGDVFAYKAEKGIRVFIHLGQPQLTDDWKWTSIPICILRSDYAKAPKLDNLLDEPVGLVCRVHPNAFPGNSKLKYLGRLSLPDGTDVQWDKIPNLPRSDRLTYLYICLRNSSVFYPESNSKKLFTCDYDNSAELFSLRSLLAPTKENLK